MIHFTTFGNIKCSNHSELQRILKEAVIASSELLTQYLPADSISASGVPPIKADKQIEANLLCI